MEKAPLFVEITQKNFKWLDSLKEKMKICESDLKQTLVVYNRGEADCGIVGLANCIKMEPGGENLRSVF